MTSQPPMDHDTFMRTALGVNGIVRTRIYGSGNEERTRLLIQYDDLVGRVKTALANGAPIAAVHYDTNRPEYREVMDGLKGASAALSADRQALLPIVNTLGRYLAQLKTHPELLYGGDGGSR